ncbi:DUF2461 domain-containing protein [Lactonifactor longoviformis]|uniref:TIGR02453 family protein n=1 Tax=Lactonifactor longoviformis DSM 17459 TaxID=1122155 RepID=A0A1M4ZB67_9CLOT|nr:DUF2461 domain-containing protein [Lactonifactor longoviformis]POP33445.1 DUF2461 domain-containing protein [Lactonifactor longoviformis]SHF15271.1 TIGR02453 family protein [Lactonifactor longoviformis DSM 17459]
MNTMLILEYLRELEENNSREWYHGHKAEYQAANGEFLKLIEAFMLELGKEDAGILDWEPGKLTFKLVRDTRFSKDKSPYLPAFRAHISSRGKLPVPVGYYLMIKPGSSFLGGGLFADMFKNATQMVRSYLAEHGEEWQSVLDAPEFQRYFQVKGTALKNVPQGFEKDHPQAEFLKYKSWYLEYPIPDRELEDGEVFLQKALKIYKAMKPFNSFLNKALKDFEMPGRP